MRSRKEIEAKYKDIEMQVIKIRDMPKSERGSIELECTHCKLTEQMATLRWVMSNDWEWDEPGIRDT